VKVALTALLVAAALRGGCVTAPAGGEPVPDWLQALIHELETEPVASPPASIASYDYNGQTVYYLSARCCDIWSNVYSASGRIICHADGGITGGGDGRCLDFLSARRNERLIWQDPRSGA
jgi:uncharacterized protein DUF6970